MKQAVIDTNIYTDLMIGYQSVETVLEEFERILLPVTVLGELLYGFTYGSREAENRMQLERFLSRDFVNLFNVSRPTAEYYALLMTSLRRNGTPLPTNDVWIAAVACSEKIPLISRDKHFLNIPGLQLIVPE
ncbi:MAG: type II toxin-antitoxin system VapC family toxin [Kiritimatiellales bacterium]|nr:type II toxin-antitoxin system VapC family toxin [Kiritimatiellota bacterium]MBL7011916.1 type II toxin-antitoxin system VapC family toxin [Kiritimatiellales bacterium]